MESIKNLDNTVIRHFCVSLSKSMDSKSDKPIKMESKNSKKRNKYKKCDPIGAAFLIFGFNRIAARCRIALCYEAKF